MFTKQKLHPRMRRNAYKSTLDLLIKLSKCPYSGQHAKRLSQQAWMISNCMRSKSCSYHGLSVTNDTKTIAAESAIKNTTRWMQNKWVDFDTFYAPFATFLLETMQKDGEIVFSIDGSELVPGHTTLMLSMIWNNFSVPICWITREGPKGHFPEEMHIDLAELGKKLVGDIECRVVLLGDGEFDGQQLRSRLNAIGWEFVLRTSKDRKIFYDDEVCRFDKMNVIKGGECLFIEGACQGDNAVAKWEKAYTDPIYLLTNMDVGGMACKYYKRRFKIEAMFKQFKSAGFDIQKSKVQDPCRIDNLLIIISLSFLLTAFIGLFIKIKPKKSHSEILRIDRIKGLSLIRIGQKCIEYAIEQALGIIAGMIRTLTCIFARAA